MDVDHEGSVRERGSLSFLADNSCAEKTLSILCALSVSALHRGHSRHSTVLTLSLSSAILRSSSSARRLFSTSSIIMGKTYKIVMIRHGESEWNQLNKFCGWYDAKLSDKGETEAKAGGKALKDAGYQFDVAHTSLLTRAQVTLQRVLEGINQTDLPTEKTWRLNERHYGALTGLNKAETAEKHGEEQVKIWRRSFDIPPPAMEKDHPYYDAIVNDER